MSIRFPQRSEWSYARHGDIDVSCYGIPIEFQESFARVLSETSALYRHLFGKHAVGHIEFNVRKSRRYPHRLWTNGADRIYLTLNKKIQLEPAAVSGVRNLHGLTHELAHIVLYRSLVNISCLEKGWGEGWAIYVASFIAVPHLYHKFGPSLWPYPHNFLDSDGPSTYLNCFESHSGNRWNSVLRVVWQLHMLSRVLGQRRFIQLLRAQLRTRRRADVFSAFMHSVLVENKILSTRRK